ncbi:4'-phosphopantetheinyl transferase family protein [Alkaliflexus imshenetskii]|uniref:4'-phosphopantetheinyl transferase family protein n=1 Tax=Alkaliflexus imshenetskii TaxID=286730 RepID=UPI00047A7027|nr:4'-phosphopantetheinyl transferase superfamily protein [Alkaliflexus imshenetskii]
MPLIVDVANSNGGRLAVWQINETEQYLLDALSPTDEMVLQLKRITCEEKRLEWLASRVLLHKLTDGCADVYYNPNGKPFIPDYCGTISISHTRGFAAVVLSPDLAGVDMEYPSPRISRIASRFIHPSHENFFTTHEADLYHALIWCAKETLYKMADCPGLIFKDDMIVLPFVAETNGVFSCRLRKADVWHEYKLNYCITPLYFIAWHW